MGAVELKIDNTTVDVPDNFGEFVKASFQVGSALNPTAKGNNVVRETTLPASPANTNLFGHPYISRLEEDANTIKSTFTALITQDGGTIFNGKAIVKYVYKNGDHPDGCTVQLYAGAAEWDDSLKLKYLTDLPFGTTSHTQAQIEDSWTAASPLYRYIPMSYGKWHEQGSLWADADYYVSIRDMRPAISWYQVMKLAFREIGYELESSFVEAAFFKKLYCPYFGRFNHSQTVMDSLAFEATRSTNYTLTTTPTVVVFDTEVSDPSAQYNPATGAFTVLNAGKYAFGGEITLERITGLAIGSFQADAYVNGVFERTISSHGFGLGATRTSETFKLDSWGDERIYLDLVAGDVVSFKFSFGAGAGHTGSVRIKSGSSIKAIPGPEIVPGASYSLEGTLDAQIPLSELIKDIFTMFNMWTYTDTSRKIVYAEPYDDFYYSTADYEDWTDKVDIGNALKMDELLTTYKNRVVFRYAEDGNDALVNQWQEQNKDIYQCYKLDLSEGFTAGEYVIETKHIAPTMQGVDTHISPKGISMPFLWQNVPASGKDLPDFITDFKPRVIYYEGVEAGIEWGWIDSDRSTDTATINGKDHKFSYFAETVYTGWPKSYAVNPDLESTPEALSWSNYSPAGGLYHNYWRNFMRSVDQGYVLTCKAKITARDIAALWDDGNQKSLWRKPLWIRDRYYTLQAIKDFNPADDGTVEIELFTYDPPFAEDPTPTRWYPGDHNPNDNMKPGPRIPVLGKGNPTTDENKSYKGTAVLQNGSNNQGTEGMGQTVIGVGLIATREDQTVLGAYNVVDDDAIVIIGAGQSQSVRRNALTVKAEADGTPYIVMPATTHATETFTGDGTIADTSEIIYVTTTAARAITLPTYAGCNFEKITVIDKTGNANTNNITINRNGTDTIRAATTYLITVNYAVTEFWKTGTAGSWTVK